MHQQPRFSRSLVSFAGHDPLGSAGLVVDARVFRHHGFVPFTVPTCLTVQDGAGVHEVIPVQAGFMTRAFTALRETLPPAGVKIGLVPSAEHMAELCRILDDLAARYVVCDPVLAASGGQSLLPASVNDACRDLFDRCSVITPNLTEALRLTGKSEAAEAGEALLAGSPKLGAAVITGVPCGSASGFGDMLFLRGTPPDIIDAPVSDRKREIHGTGCHYSSALLCALARNMRPGEAVREAQTFLARRVAGNRVKVAGPMDMLY